MELEMLTLSLHIHLCSFGLELFCGLMKPPSKYLSVLVYSNVFDKSLHFREGLFLCPQSQVQKEMSVFVVEDLHSAMTSTPSNIFEMN